MSVFNKKLSAKTSHIPQSYFDDDYPDSSASKFWFQKELPAEIKKGPSFGCFLYKRSKKKFGELKPVYICLCRNHLISSQSKDWANRQVKSIDLRRHFLAFTKLTTLPGKYGAGISLAYNQKQIELFAKNAEELNGFLYHLKRNVIQTNFEENYVLEQRLGSGSYADVFLVKDKVTRREYAAKFFDTSSFRDTDRSKVALMNEIGIHRQLEHGNICRLHEVYESPTHIIIVMEYAKGERLIDHVINNSPLKEKECMTILKELLEAVIYIHSLNIMHRDIKLENVMINIEDGQAGQPNRVTVKLIDFGLSVTTDNIEFFKRSGTPGYVAPEVLTADTYDQKIDVFSLGVILFTLLAGRTPFVGNDRAAVLKLNKNCDYAFKPKYWNSKTFTCKDLVKKMMEADPEKRLSPQQCLNHKWFNLLNNMNNSGVQSLVTLSKDQITSRSNVGGNAQDQLAQKKSFERNIEKSNTVSGDTVRKIIQGANGNQNPGNPNRSNSVKANNSVGYSTKRSLHSKHSNMLQVPGQRGGTFEDDDEEEKSGHHSYDGMNKGSIKSFYKLNSAEEPEPIIEEISPYLHLTYDAKDIPLEDENQRSKVPSLKHSYKSLKSPFRLDSKEPNMLDSSQDDKNNDSCDVSSLDFSDYQIRIVPKYPPVFKASMAYIKRTSKIRA